MSLITLGQYLAGQSVPHPWHTISVLPGVEFLPDHFTEAGLLLIRSVVLTAPAMFSGKIVITSGCDGKHMEGSLHWKGMAIDWRTVGHREGAIFVPGPEPKNAEEEEACEAIQRNLAKSWAGRIARFSDFKVQAIVKPRCLHTEYDVKGAR